MFSFSRLQRGIEKLARRVGIHVATHQIRLILISSVVITSLFYPALALYSRSSQKGILDSFLAARLNSQAGSLRNVLAARLTPKHDLVSVWEGHNGLKVTEDSVPRSIQCARLGFQVERLLLQTEDADAVTNEEILYKTLRLERRIAELRFAEPILELSPLAFWEHDDYLLTRDPNVLDTLGPSRNVSIRGINITPNMVLAGRGKDESATFLAVTYIFPLTPQDDTDDCPSRTIHRNWLDLLKEAAGERAHVGPGIEEPTFVTLEYDDRRMDRSPVTQTMLYIAYTAFLAYVTYSIRLMHSVHSRVGLAFTAIIEIVISTIISLSLCALFGLRVDRVPWAFLIIVILCVGAENMFTLVDAVVSTPVTLAVKDRIGVGLARAGTSNTFKVVSYNMFLACIAGLVQDDTIRQFCVFAIIVLIAHWFLAHTFFLAVLSIDIQRLDLEEVLRQNAASAKSPTKAEFVEDPWQKWKQFLGGRAVKNLSFVLLVLITSTLYYTTFTHPADMRVFNQRAALTRSSSQTSPPTNQLSGSYRVWKTFSPASLTPVPLRIESPTIITFGTYPGVYPVPRRRSRWLPLRDLHPLIWLIKIVSLQISITTTILYFLCKYLLKDADALDAHRTHPNSLDDIMPHEVETEIDLDAEFAGKTQFQALPRAFASDVELIASSHDGRLVASVGTYNELVIWSTETQAHIRISTKDLMFMSASTSSARLAISAVAIESKGRSIAVGTAAGVIGIWSVEASGVKSLPHLVRSGSPAGVKDLYFTGTDPIRHSLVALYDDQTAVKWNLEDGPSMAEISPSLVGTVLQCMAFTVGSRSDVLLCFNIDDGALDIVDPHPIKSDAVSVSLCTFSVGSALDPVIAVHGIREASNNSNEFLIAAVTRAGYISLWDCLTGENITTFEDAFGAVSALRIVQVPSKICGKCNELPPEAFVLSFSVGSYVLVYKLHIPSQSRLCSCKANLTRLKVPGVDVADSRSRSGSKASTNGIGAMLAPPNGRTRLGVPSSFNATTAFPVSGHGMHSRRAEKDLTRRLSDISLPPPMVGGLLEPPSPVSSRLPRGQWETVYAALLNEVPCERGGWDVVSEKLVGIRRRRRTPVKTRRPKISGATSQDAVLDPSTTALERWELWSFDLVTGHVSSSPVSRLHYGAPGKDIYPRLPFTRANPFVASKKGGIVGLGNAVGLFTFAS